MSEERDVNRMGKEALKQEVIRLRKELEMQQQFGQFRYDAFAALVLANVEEKVIPLWQEYSNRLQDLKQLLGRIDELAQNRRNIRKDAFGQRLEILSAELGKGITNYRNTVEKIAGKGVDVSEAGDWVKTGLTFQNHIAAYFRGEDDGSSLAALYGNMPGNMWYANWLSQLKWGGNDKPNSPGKWLVGKYLSEMFKGERRPDVAGAVFALKDKLEHLTTKTDEEKSMHEWLSGYAGNRLSKRASDAKQDYEKTTYPLFAQKTDDSQRRLE